MSKQGAMTAALSTYADVHTPHLCLTGRCTGGKRGVLEGAQVYVCPRLRPHRCVGLVLVCREGGGEEGL